MANVAAEIAIFSHNITTNHKDHSTTKWAYLHLLGTTSLYYNCHHK